MRPDNDFTKDTYGVYANKVYHLPMSVTTESELIPARNYSVAKKIKVIACE